MKRIHDFGSFINEKRLNESSSEENTIKGKIMKYVLETDNKGGDPALADKIVDEIASLVKSPSEIFDYLTHTGLGSIPTLDIGFALFSKFGMLQSNMPFNIAKSIVQASAKVKKMYETLTSSKAVANSSVIFKNAASQDIIERAKQNLSNWSEIGKYNDIFLDLASAINDDTISNLDQDEKTMFVDMAAKFISVYENASKLKKQSPNLYKELEGELGDDVDLSAGLGNIGFE